MPERRVERGQPIHHVVRRTWNKSAMGADGVVWHDRGRGGTVQEEAAARTDGKNIHAKFQLAEWCGSGGGGVQNSRRPHAKGQYGSSVSILVHLFRFPGSHQEVRSTRNPLAYCRRVLEAFGVSYMTLSLLSRARGTRRISAGFHTFSSSSTPPKMTHYLPRLQEFGQNTPRNRRVCM